MYHQLVRRGSSRYSVAIVVTLALGIAVATALFPMLLSALTSAGWLEENRIVSLMAEDRRLGVRTSVEEGTLRRWQEALRCCTTLEGLGLADAVMRLEAGAQRVHTVRVGDHFFELMEVRPLSGRVLNDADAGASVALVTRRMADAHLGGVQEALGKRIVLDGETVLVVGVLPQDFHRDLHLTTALDVVRPLDTSETPGLLVYARLREGVSPRQAQAELDHWASAQPGRGERQDWVVLSSNELMETHTRKMLELALIGGLALLTVTGANVSHLLMARHEERRKELATRWALGATRWAQIKWQIREVAVLAAISGLAAAVLAEGGLRFVAAVIPEELRVLTGTGLDPKAFAFALTIGLLTLACFGVLPSVLRRTATLTSDLGSDRRLGRRPGWGARLGGLHVVTMAAAAFVLAVVAHLLLASVLMLSRLDLGFEARGLHAIHLDRHRKPSGGAGDAFVRAYMEGLRALPGVESLAIASLPPPGSGIYLGQIRFSSRDDPGTVLMGAGMTSVSDGYFRTVRQEVLAGREFVAEDVRSNAPVLVVSETAARHLGADPGAALGRTVWLDGQSRTVVGVVRDIHAPELLKPFGQMQLYRPLSDPDRGATVLVRSSLPIGTAARSIGKELDPDAVVETSSVEGLFWEALSTIRSLTVLLSLLLLVVLALALTGVYGVFSGFAERQRGQVAVRMILGARRAEVRRRMLFQGLRLSLVGILLGLLASYPLSRLVEAQLFGLAHDSVSARLGGALLVLTVSLAAVWIPAVRTARVDPGDVLRTA